MFCNVAHEVFCALLKQGRSGGTGCVGEQGHGRSGEQTTGAGSVLFFLYVRVDGFRSIPRGGC
jgi:hypothetical protein